jgi:hypothetical protein
MIAVYSGNHAIVRNTVQTQSLFVLKQAVQRETTGLTRFNLRYTYIRRGTLCVHGNKQ